ncbi:glutamate receptor ionotropic, delta-1-like [Gigantopelta aegis]|uniref:glutamate receptor ionotropic, delta-1-like n=1 Tax=Gigantopelta aegis TaxID=1735272 RepID=UPI001B88C979|nr:glutamate receptor ionotropic, delta-1-like [Gigantopelta aegis]
MTRRQYVVLFTDGAPSIAFKLVEPEDGRWGDVHNGSWSGLIGQLQRQEVDLTAAPLAIEPKREEVMDFIFPFFYEYTTVLIKKPDPNKRKWRTLIDPFKWQVLLCIGVSLVFTTFFFFLLERWNPYYSDKKYGGRTRSGRIFSDAFWYMYGALLTQGGEHLPYSQTGRTVVSMWWLFSIVMAATYSGNLIAFLTVTKDKLPFNNLQTMVNQDEYKWGTVGGTIWPLIFKRSNRSVYQKIWNGLKTFNASDTSILSTNATEHLHKVKNGGYAYIGDRSMMEVWLADECDLQFIKEQFLPMQYAFGLPNNSPYKQVFRDEMLQIYESGLLQIWKKRLWPRNTFCEGTLTAEAKPISVIDVQSAFYMIGIGIFGAALALLIERVLHIKTLSKSHLPHLPTMKDQVK